MKTIEEGEWKKFSHTFPLPSIRILQISLLHAAADDRDVRDLCFYMSDRPNIPVKIAGCSDEICAFRKTIQLAGTLSGASIVFDNEKVSLDNIAFWDYVDATAQVTSIAFDPIADVTYTISKVEFSGYYNIMVEPSLNILKKV